MVQPNPDLSWIEDDDEEDTDPNVSPPWSRAWTELRAKTAGTYDRHIGECACTGSRYVRGYCERCLCAIRVSQWHASGPVLCEDHDPSAARFGMRRVGHVLMPDGMSSVCEDWLEDGE